MNKASLQQVIGKLENLFSKFNEHFYDGELQTPVIATISVGNVVKIFAEFSKDVFVYTLTPVTAQ